MSTATVIQLNTFAVLSDLTPCTWYRIKCPDCGTYDVGIGADSLPPETCECGELVTVSHAARGLTRSELPTVSIPAFTGDGVATYLNRMPKVFKNGSGFSRKRVG